MNESLPQVVVITGASAGVGRATVRAFAKRRARIGLMARGRDGLDAARREVEAAGGEAIVLPADVAAADAVERRFGPIDVWINNAMTSVFSPVHELQPDEVRRVTDVTYHGTVYGTLAALRRMRLRNRGVIIQVGSALAHRAIPLQAAYCGAKHAMEGFTESLRSELLHDGSEVRVNMVHLPALNTPQHGWVKSRLPRKAQPVPPIFQPEVAADAIVWASEHDRRELWVGASTSIVLMGNKFAPGLGDWYLAHTGYESQMTDEAADPDRPHNLWNPVPGDHGAHGDFGGRAKSSCAQLWLTTHRGLVAATLCGAAGVIGLLVANRSVATTRLVSSNNGSARPNSRLR